MNELKKGCKIVDEVMLFLVKNGHNKVSVDFEIDDNKMEFTFKTNELEEELVEQLNKYINMERELEVEVYGWELMGESSATNELELIGLLVDKLDVINLEGSTILKMVRYDKY